MTNVNKFLLLFFEYWACPPLAGFWTASFSVINQVLHGAKSPNFNCTCLFIPDFFFFCTGLSIYTTPVLPCFTMFVLLNSMPVFNLSLLCVYCWKHFHQVFIFWLHRSSLLWNHSNHSTCCCTTSMINESQVKVEWIAPAIKRIVSLIRTWYIYNIKETPVCITAGWSCCFRKATPQSVGATRANTTLASNRLLNLNLARKRNVCSNVPPGQQC